MLGYSLMYFVKFSDALRGKFMNCEDPAFETRSFSNSLAATLLGFAFYLARSSSSIRGCRG